MARHPDPSNASVYDVADQWIEKCLDGDGSLLSAGESIWTADTLAEVFDRVWVHGDETEGAGYFEKLLAQLEGASSASIQLAAEIHIVHYLSIWPGALTGATKQKHVERILGWMPAPAPALPADIIDVFQHGLAHPGRFAM